MLAEYRHAWPFVNALYLTYSAKVRAQATAGVGSKTDVFYIGPQGLWFLNTDEMAMLKQAHEQKEANYRWAENLAYAAIQNYINSAMARQAQVPVAQQSTNISVQSSPEDAAPERDSVAAIDTEVVRDDEDEMPKEVN